MPTRYKLTLQRHHVEVLQKSKSESVVNLEKGPDHRTGESFFNQVVARHPSKLRSGANIKSSNPATRILNATTIDPPNPVKSAKSV